MSNFITVATISEIPPGQARVVSIDGRSIALCHVENDGVYAIDNICTHDDGPLGEGELTGDCIECPRDGALFNVKNGKAKTFPAVGRVSAHEVRIINGEVQVSLNPVTGTGL